MLTWISVRKISMIYLSMWKKYINSIGRLISLINLISAIYLNIHELDNIFLTLGFSCKTWRNVIMIQLNWLNALY